MFCLWCVEPKTSPKEDILDQSEPMTKSAMESSNQPSKNVRLRYQLLHYVKSPIYVQKVDLTKTFFLMVCQTKEGLLR